MLARALEDKLVDEMKALLDPMLAVGLRLDSPDFIA